MYPYAYLVWCGIFALAWAVLYWMRKDTRREMLLLSLFAAPLGPLTEYFHVIDYWRPETITGTLIGPEDIIVAFLIGGISAGLYSFVMNTKHVRAQREGILPLILFAYVIGVVLLVGGFMAGLSSVQAAFLLLALFAAIPCIMKPWIVRGALASSVLFGAFLFAFYLIFYALYPGIVDAWWFGASGHRLIGVPVEEIVWGLLWGAVGASGTEMVARLKLPRYIR